MLSDRSCDNHRSHLEQWLKRGDQLRATVANHVTQKSSYMSPKTGATLTRSRSLEILDDSKLTKRLDMNVNLALGRSCDLLDGNSHEVQIHHNMNDEMDAGHSNSAHRSAILSGSDCRRYSSSHERDKHSTCGGPYESQEFPRRRHSKSKQSVAERLEELLSRTNEIIQMERIVRRKYKEKALNADYRDHVSKHSTSDKYKTSPSSRREQHDSGLSMYEDGLMKICQGLDHNLSNDEIADEMKNITVALGSSLSSCRSKSATSSSHRSIQSFEPSSRHAQKTDKHKDFRLTGEDYAASSCGADEDDDTPHALRSHSMAETSTNNDVPNDTTNFNCGFFQNTCFDDVSSVSSNTLKSTKIDENASNSVSGTDELDGRCDLPAMADMKELYELKSRILNGTQWRSQVLRKSTQDVAQRTGNDSLPSPSSGAIPVTATVEVHAEPSTNTTKDQDANSQSNSEESSDEESQISRPPTIGPKPAAMQADISTTAPIVDASSTPKVPASKPNAFNTRYLIPKDAYFHELPAKKEAAERSDQENGLSLPPRNRKPLPYSNSDDEILTNSQPPPLIMTNYLKNMNLNNNNSSSRHAMAASVAVPCVPDFRQSKTDYAIFRTAMAINPSAQHSASPPMPPTHERLLSNRKFTAMPNATPLPSAIPCESGTKSFARQNGHENGGVLEYDSGNHREFERYAGSVMSGAMSCNGNHSSGPNTLTSSSEFIFASNIGASSLV